MKIEDKGGLPKIRIAVVGQSNVGKSALTVRFLTGRYIGEYSSDTDLLYRQTVRPASGGPAADVEIVDVCASSAGAAAFPEEAALWADAVAVVYSVTCRASFAAAAALLRRLRGLRGAARTPALLLANKADLGHLRRVPAAEGRAAAAARAALFADAARPKFSVARALAQLLQLPAQAQAHARAGRGSVAPCRPADLHRRRVARRRRDAAAASL